MKNIAFLIDTIACDTAGTQKQLLEIIRRLDRDRFAPHLICLWESAWMRSHDLPCPVHVLGHQGFLKPGFPGVVRRLGALIDEQDFRLIHVFFDEAIIVGWLGAGSAQNRPVLLSSRRDMGLGVGNQPWYHRLFPLVLPRVNRDFALIVTNSDAVSRYASRRERTPLSRFKVIRNGVDVAPPAGGIPLGLQGATHALRVGIVASLTPVKRHDVLLRAWARLPTAVAGAHLYLLGEGPTRDALAGLAKSLGIEDRVHFVGAVHDVPDWLRHLDVGVLCSDREGLSNAILEYMAQGLPVVATRVGGNPELVSADNGILVPSGDAAALATALATLLEDEDLRRRLGAASARTVREHYSWAPVMGQLMASYDDLLGSPESPSTGAST